jgi:hypothetical protein
LRQWLVASRKELTPFFTPGTGHNKEGIPQEDFKNAIYLEPMITVPLKSNDFSVTAMKWAIQQFTEWS